MVGFEKQYGTLSIPDYKIDAFLHDVRQVVDKAGLFATRHMRVYDEEFDLLCFLNDQKDTLSFDYSYFEDAQHERVTIDLNSIVIHSNQTGCGSFGAAVQVLYLLADSYSETCYHFGSCSNDILRWLSYVLHRPVTSACGGYLWDVYEQFMCDHDVNTKLSAMDFFNEYVGDAVNFDEISTIVYVNDAITEEYIENCLKQKEPDDKSSYGFWVRSMARFLWLAKRDSAKSESELLSRYMKLLYKVSEIRDDIIAGKSVSPVKELFAVVAPPITVKLIATIYGLDFWQLWRENKDGIGMTSSIFYNQERNEINEEEAELDTLKPLTTEEFFGVAPEDRLYWWKEDGDVVIDGKTQKWLEDMAEQHRSHIETMADEFSAIDWHQRLVKLLGKHKDSIKMFEHLYCEFLNTFHLKEFRAWIEMLEVLAESELSECRRLIAVLANDSLRIKFFGL